MAIFPVSGCFFSASVLVTAKALRHAKHPQASSCGLARKGQSCPPTLPQFARTSLFGSLGHLITSYQWPVDYSHLSAHTQQKLLQLQFSHHLQSIQLHLQSQLQTSVRLLACLNPQCAPIAPNSFLSHWSHVLALPTLPSEPCCCFKSLTTCRMPEI